MPGRKKPRGDDQALNPVLETVLALPAARVSHRHTHEPDPYESPPGAVRVTSQDPPKRNPTREDKRGKSLAKAEQTMRANRYDRYLDLLLKHEGNEVEALAEVYGLAPDAVLAQRRELAAD